MHQKNKKNKWSVIYGKNEQWKYRHDMDRLQKIYDMIPKTCITECLKMSKTSEQVLNFIIETMKYWRTTRNWKKNPGRDKNPKKHLSGKLIITAIICYSYDVTNLYTNKKQRQLQIYKSSVESEGIELPNQEKIRTLGEKEKYEYLEKYKRNILEQENSLRPNSVAEIWSKE